jgi:hypothetical protein
MAKVERAEVATGGTIPRRDECEQCGQPMLYWVNEQAVPSSKFCQNMACTKAFLCFPLVAAGVPSREEGPGERGV